MADVYRSPCGAVELRLGRYQDVLADVEPDAAVCDPPYSKRTHNGQRFERRDRSYVGGRAGSLTLAHRGLEYAAWTPADVEEFMDRWASIPGWLCAFTSHDLTLVYEAAAKSHKRTTYAPLACIQFGANVRLAGDGPANWNTPLCVSRPKSLARWGALRGGYAGPCHDPGENALDRSKRAVPGGKPLWLMRQIIRDYTRPGDLIADTCAGGATTLLAAAIEGRRAIGAEMDPETFAKAVKRLEKGWTGQLAWKPEARAPMVQEGLALDTSVADQDGPTAEDEAGPDAWARDAELDARCDEIDAREAQDETP